VATEWPNKRLQLTLPALRNFEIIARHNGLGVRLSRVLPVRALARPLKRGVSPLPRNIRQLGCCYSRKVLAIVIGLSAVAAFCPCASNAQWRVTHFSGRTGSGTTNVAISAYGLLVALRATIVRFNIVVQYAHKIFSGIRRFSVRVIVCSKYRLPLEIFLTQIL
jgi:hypothetical protein